MATEGDEDGGTELRSHLSLAWPQRSNEGPPQIPAWPPRFCTIHSSPDVQGLQVRRAAVPPLALPPPPLMSPHNDMHFEDDFHLHRNEHVHTGSCHAPNLFESGSCVAHGVPHHMKAARLHCGGVGAPHTDDRVMVRFGSSRTVSSDVVMHSLWHLHEHGLHSVISKLTVKVDMTTLSRRCGFSAECAHSTHLTTASGRDEDRWCRSHFGPSCFSLSRRCSRASTGFSFLFASCQDVVSCRAEVGVRSRWVDQDSPWESATCRAVAPLAEADHSRQPGVEGPLAEWCPQHVEDSKQVAEPRGSFVVVSKVEGHQVG